MENALKVFGAVNSLFETGLKFLAFVDSNLFLAVRLMPLDQTIRILLKESMKCNNSILIHGLNCLAAM